MVMAVAFAGASPVQLPPQTLIADSVLANSVAAAAASTTLPPECEASTYTTLKAVVTCLVAIPWMEEVRAKCAVDQIWNMFDFYGFSDLVRDSSINDAELATCSGYEDFTVYDFKLGAYLDEMKGSLYKERSAGMFAFYVYEMTQMLRDAHTSLGGTPGIFTTVNFPLTFDVVANEGKMYFFFQDLANIEKDVVMGRHPELKAFIDSGNATKYPLKSIKVPGFSEALTPTEYFLKVADKMGSLKDISVRFNKFIEGWALGIDQGSIVPPGVCAGQVCTKEELLKDGATNVTFTFMNNFTITSQWIYGTSCWFVRPLSVDDTPLAHAASHRLPPCVHLIGHCSPPCVFARSDGRSGPARNGQLWTTDPVKMRTLWLTGNGDGHGLWRQYTSFWTDYFNATSMPCADAIMALEDSYEKSLPSSERAKHKQLSQQAAVGAKVAALSEKKVAAAQDEVRIPRCDMVVRGYATLAPVPDNKTMLAMPMCSDDLGGDEISVTIIFGEDSSAHGTFVRLMSGFPGPTSDFTSVCKNDTSIYAIGGADQLACPKECPGSFEGKDAACFIWFQSPLYALKVAAEMLAPNFSGGNLYVDLMGNGGGAVTTGYLFNGAPACQSSHRTALLPDPACRAAASTCSFWLSLGDADYLYRGMKWAPTFAEPMDSCEWYDFPEAPLLAFLVTGRSEPFNKLSDMKDPQSWIEYYLSRIHFLQNLVNDLENGKLPLIAEGLKNHLGNFAPYLGLETCFKTLLSMYPVFPAVGTPAFAGVEAAYDNCFAGAGALGEDQTVVFNGYGASNLKPEGREAFLITDHGSSANVWQHSWNAFKKVVQKKRDNPDGSGIRNFTSLNMLSDCQPYQWWLSGGPPKTDPPDQETIQAQDYQKYFGKPQTTLKHIFYLLNGNCGSTCSVTATRPFVDGLSTVIPVGGILQDGKFQKMDSKHISSRQRAPSLHSHTDVCACSALHSHIVQRWQQERQL